MDNFTSAINTTASILNETTSRGPTPLPATPPPLGYYGETREMLWKVISPIIMVWGTVGNILIFIVLLRQKNKISSTALYLMALAVSDTIVLYTGPLRQWMKQTWNYDIRWQTDAGCKFQVYLTYASLHCSSWLLVAVTLERAVSVVFPHKVRIVSTKRTAMIAIFAIFMFTYGLNIFHLVIMGLKGYRTLQPCAPKTKEYLEFRDDIYVWIDFCVAFAAPFILLLIGNISIIVYLQKSRAKQKTMAAARGQTGASSARDTRSVSVLMVALCVIFCLTVTPASLFNAILPYKAEEINELFKTDPYKAWDDYQFLSFQHAIVNLVSYTNASFNFILYVFSGSKFRKELKAMVGCQEAGTSGVFGSKSKSPSNGKTTTTSVSATKESQYQYVAKSQPTDTTSVSAIKQSQYQSTDTKSKNDNVVHTENSAINHFDSVVENDGQAID
ncbi:cysteinyl leukotriene receptor 1-like [Mercenaria mercenaria]|uniref:cysteinyl leukotriene receptor 1-like n=1 Tax=Mercenaria mercenaria TaxID=6596 RepID=UPI00234EFE74|nr:cysteinyl leukotriene receptor 1-like [Mercenaria mercenaria]